MIIQLKKFGITLVSRPSGKEAWLAFQPVLNQMQQVEKIIVDFDGVAVLTPSWADEFLTPLRGKFKKRVELLNIDNPSVKATLAILTKQ
ncbi:STAS-like domain-containing protein [Patescibacteria group bacterium]|nr:STAS-like domain-containing protein [Patescibacteria group bacterium]MBU1473029.1 STAS-like domain-containing protein [Patescibacteria group bacterium]MBU2460215.1 STAS-like domain-containing protein [Patescibacteria group bacterium]MBU2543898.1 STAS-like domain-containing protein [Patescibacteria group bacterium]